MLGHGPLTYRANENTRRGWDAGRRGRSAHHGEGRPGPHVMPGSTAGRALHRAPAGSCRIGDDPATSALTTGHELRGHPGMFVTDGRAVPAALTVNPALTIAALAERACLAIVRGAEERGVNVTYGAPSPSPGMSAARRPALDRS